MKFLKFSRFSRPSNQYFPDNYKVKEEENAKGCNMAIGHAVPEVIIEYSVLVVRSGYTGNVVV